MLKQNQKESDTQEQPKHKENKEEHPESKSIQVAIDLLKVLNFVQETKQTLSNYSKQVQIHLDINLTHQEMSFDTCKLLNKNLNFIPTSKDITKIN